MKNTISKGWLSLLIVMGILILDQIIKIAVKTNMYYTLIPQHYNLTLFISS